MLIPDLKRLLDEDLERRRVAQAGRMDAIRRGDINASSDAAMNYGNQYRVAFVRIGGDEAVSILSAYLEDRAFGLDAALGIKEISDQQLNTTRSPKEVSGLARWPDFGEVAAVRESRASKSDNPPANALAVPIFAAIDRLAQPSVDEQGQLLAIALAHVALAMPHGNQDDLMRRVVALSPPLKTKCRLFTGMILDGQIVDAGSILTAIDEWLADAQRDAWQKRQHTWEIEPWLELLPFSTRPEAVCEGMTKVKAFYGTGWAQRWEQVVAAVAAVAGPEGDTLLVTLARTQTDIADGHTWFRAFLQRGRAASILQYFDLYAEGVFANGPHQMDAWHIGREIAAHVPKFPELRAELLKRYEEIGPGVARKTIEHFLAEAADEDALIAVIKKYVAELRAFDGGIAGTIRSASLRQVPVSEGSNSYYIEPVPIPRARKLLFDLLSGKLEEGTLARRCLIVIDELRDDHGIAADDTRHPDILSERPWPTEVAIQ